MNVNYMIQKFLPFWVFLFFSSFLHFFGLGIFCNDFQTCCYCSGLVVKVHTIMDLVCVCVFEYGLIRGPLHVA
ncbi:hypothetical protein QBC45DRAFT_424317 [Copromyces sp. CBS 386.78]|nr:hypothetical protein QBC45DRAFT_424317 [Copromyces sp. CBS 386.78]